MCLAKQMPADKGGGDNLDTMSAWNSVLTAEANEATFSASPIAIVAREPDGCRRLSQIRSQRFSTLPHDITWRPRHHAGILDRSINGPWTVRSPKRIDCGIDLSE